MPESKTAPRSEEPLGGGLYRDLRGKSKSFVWRGRVNGRPVRRVLRRPETGMTATVENTTLTEARRIAADMKADAMNGGSRHFTHILDKPRSGDFTVEQAWSLYISKATKLRARTRERKESLYRRFIGPAWGNRSVRGIRSDDCRKLISTALLALEAKGHHGTPVIKLHSDLNCFFDFCHARYETGVKSNPMLENGKMIPVPVEANPKPPRALDVQELKWFFQAAQEWATAPLSKQALRRSVHAPLSRKRSVEATEALLRSVCRRDEILTARWGWMQPGGLLIPPHVAKEGIHILVPLTKSILDLIGARPANATDDDLIFEYSGSWLERSVGGIRHVMTRIAGISGDFANKNDPRHFSLHNFRDTFLTLMKQPRNGWKQPIFGLDVRNACLNHRNKGDVGNRCYDAQISDSDWMYEERLGAGEYWNGWLDHLKAEALGDRANR